jgi:hypothetical protein
MSIQRSASRSSTLRSDSGYRTYIITTTRITSGELSKYRNGLWPDASLAQTPRAFRLTKPDTLLITAPAPSRTTADNKFSPLRLHSIIDVASISWCHLPLGLVRLEPRSERLVWVEPSMADNSPVWALGAVGRSDSALFYCVLKRRGAD